MSSSSPLAQAFRALLARYGPQGWWPAESPWEVMVGAILTQNTAWRNVEQAISRLKQHDVLSVSALDAIRQEALEELIRPAGYFRQKAHRLKNLAHHLVTHHAADVAHFLSQPPHELRRELLGLHGIGRETADSILLYAAGYPEFVIDAYTARVLKRHAWMEPEADYEAMKCHFEEQLTKDAELFNEFHALIVRVGKDHCRPRPHCEGCPLESLLPEGGLAVP